jgi:amidophosphoribosyltransferase
MGQVIGANSLAFFSTKGLLEVGDVDIGETSSRCLACFSGAYPTEI